MYATQPRKTLVVVKTGGARRDHAFLHNSDGVTMKDLDVWLASVEAKIKR